MKRLLLLMLLCPTGLFAQSVRYDNSPVTPSSLTGNFVCRSDASCSSMSVPLTVNSSVTVNSNGAFTKTTGVTSLLINSSDNNANLTINAASGEATVVTNTGNLNLTATSGYSTKVTGSAFSVGGSSLAVVAGKVGVGMTPTTTLDIMGVAGNYPTVQIAVSSMGVNGEAIRFQRTDSTGLRYSSIFTRSSTTAGDNYIAFKVHDVVNSTSQTEVLRMTGSGNVGIGTTAPASKLDIEGKGWNDGYARGIYAYNRSGATISSGTIVSNNPFASSTVDVTTAAAQSESPVGTVYDTTCADDAVCRICTEGLCDVLLDSAENCATTDLVVVTGDENGRADCLPNTVARHNGEVGQPQTYSTYAGQVIKVWAHRN